LPAPGGAPHLGTDRIQIVLFDIVHGAGPVLGGFNTFDVETVPAIKIKLIDIAVEILDLDGCCVFIKCGDLELLRLFRAVIPFIDNRVGFAGHAGYLSVDIY